MSKNKILLSVVSILLLVVVVVVGLNQVSEQEQAGSTTSVPTNTEQALKGSPPALAELHAQANQLLPGTPTSVKRRIASFKTPVVLNKWASWCAPCKFEFPFLQTASLKYGKRIAFLGLNSGDNREDAKKFLKTRPVSYPSYEDPKEKIAQALKIGNNYPMTVFYDRKGKVAFIHQGGYPSQQKLNQDIQRYALRVEESPNDL